MINIPGREKQAEKELAMLKELKESWCGWSRDRERENDSR